MSAVPNRRPTVIFGSRAGLLDVLSTDLWWHRAGFLWLLTSFDSFDHLYSGRNLSDGGSRTGGWQGTLSMSPRRAPDVLDG